MPLRVASLSLSLACAFLTRNCLTFVPKHAFSVFRSRKAEKPPHFLPKATQKRTRSSCSRQPPRRRRATRARSRPRLYVLSLLDDGARRERALFSSEDARINNDKNSRLGGGPPPALFQPRRRLRSTTTTTTTTRKATTPGGKVTATKSNNTITRTSRGSHRSTAFPEMRQTRTTAKISR